MNQFIDAKSHFPYFSYSTGLHSPSLSNPVKSVLPGYRENCIQVVELQEATIETVHSLSQA